MTPDLEQLKLDPNQEEITKVLYNDAFLEWEKQFNAYGNEIKKSGTDLARFWLWQPKTVRKSTVHGTRTKISAHLGKYSTYV